MIPPFQKVLSQLKIKNPCSGAITDRCPGLDNIDLTFGTPEEVAELEKLRLSERVDLYKKRVYGLVHRGYTILQVSFIFQTRKKFFIIWLPPPFLIF